MNWSSIRDFLDIPKNVTGKGVNIAILDGGFTCHPDIISNENRNTYLVKTHTNNPKPILLTDDMQFDNGLHGLWAASAAGGNGLISKGKYSGIAPESNLYLIDAGKLTTTEDVEKNIANALIWLKDNGLKYGIKGVVLTVVGQRDTGLLPWQADPLRILCAELVHEGILVVASSGNNKELTSSSVISPSVLSVGGVTIPQNAKKESAESFLGSNGYTFDGKWNPDVLAPAMNIVLPYPFKSEEERLKHYTVTKDNLPPNYARQWGTSFAAPIVLGFAACIWQLHPFWSAEEVKKAIVSSATFSRQWDSLRAGIISPEALKMDNDRMNQNRKDSLYLSWKQWRERPLLEKLDKISSAHHDDILDILLSFLPDKVPIEAIKSIRKLLLHPSSKIRTAAITVLSTQASYISKSDILYCLEDESPEVRMGGIYALSFCPNFWGDLSQSFSNLINDKNTDIRYNACKLAIKIKSIEFIQPLIEGLEEDALQKRIGTFGKRHTALQIITGNEIKREPDWQEGEDPYSDRSIEALLKIAKKWKHYLTMECDNVI
jgi:hypothetical protein